MKQILVKNNNNNFSTLNEMWTLYFIEHKELIFETREDLEKYLNGGFSEAHGFMEYERIPESVEHTVYYNIETEMDSNAKE